MAVDADHGDVPLHGEGEIGAATARGKDHAGHRVTDGDPEVLLFAHRVLVGVAQHDGVAAGAGDVLDRSRHDGEERVLDVGDHHRDDLRGTGAQAAGVAVGHEAQLAGGEADGDHPVGGDLDAVEDARHRCGGDSRAGCDVVDGDHQVVLPPEAANQPLRAR